MCEVLTCCEMCEVMLTCVEMCEALTCCKMCEVVGCVRC